MSARVQYVPYLSHDVLRLSSNHNPSTVPCETDEPPHCINLVSPIDNLGPLVYHSSLYETMHFSQQIANLLFILPFSTTTAQPLADQVPLAPPGPHTRLRPPIGQLPVIMSPGGGGDDSAPKIQTQPAVALADVLGPNRALTTFSSLSRHHVATNALLDDRACDPPLTVLAPLNSAFDALPRKPWEHPAGSNVDSFAGPDGKDRADSNLARLVDAHIVGQSPWDQGDKAKTLGGRELWWEERNGKMLIMPDEVEVERVASRVANGELWIIRGVLNYQ
ncbi:FAS1 domain-containing protein [Paramyrothecium foliicola]|nr:FAS1 domain-containing protein [Paramyrothecium foliicola]